MTRIELAGLMLGLLAVSVAGGISWRLFRPHRGAHVYDLAPVPIPRLEYGSMILEEETRIRVHERETAPLRSTGGYLEELAPEALEEEWPGELRGEAGGSDRGVPGPVRDARGDRAGGVSHSVPGTRDGDPDNAAEVAPALVADLADEMPDLISMMSDEDFFHMARFEFRRLEWMASEPLTLPAWTGRAA